jgi:hypothetical protein
MRTKIITVISLLIFLCCFQIAWAHLGWDPETGHATPVPQPAQNPPETTTPPADDHSQDGTEPVDPGKRDKVDEALRENGIDPDELSDDATVEEVTDVNGSDAQEIQGHVHDRITQWNGEIPAMDDNRIQATIPQLQNGDVVVRDPTNGALHILRPDNPANPTRYNLVYSEDTQPYDTDPDTQGDEGKMTTVRWYDNYGEDNGHRTRTEHAIQELDEDGDGNVDKVSVQPENVQEYGEYKDMNTGEIRTGWYDKEDHDVSYWDKDGNPIAPLYSPFADGKPIYVDMVYTPDGKMDYTFKSAPGDDGEILATRHKEWLSTPRRNIYGHTVTYVDETHLNLSALKEGYEVDFSKFASPFKNYLQAQLRYLENNPDWFSDVEEIVWYREYGIKGRDASGNQVSGLLFTSVGYESQKLGLRQAGAIWTGEGYAGYIIDRSRKNGDRYDVELGFVGRWNRDGSLTSKRRILRGRLVNDNGVYKLDLQNIKLQEENPPGRGNPPGGGQGNGGNPAGGGNTNPGGTNINTRQDAISDYQRLRNMPLDQRLDELVNRGVIDPVVAETIKGLNDEDARRTYLARSLYLKNLGLNGEQSVHLLGLLGNKEEAVNYLCEVLGITPEEAEEIYNTLLGIQGQDLLRWYFELLNYSDEEIQNYLELTEPEEKERYLREVFGINDEELIQEIMNLNIDEAYEFLKNRSLDIDIDEFLALETDREKEEYLINYLLEEKGMSEEDARVKANEILNIINNGGALEEDLLLSLGLSQEQIDHYNSLTADHARIDYLTSVAGLPLYTAQLIVGKMINENGELVDLPDDYLNPIFDAMETVVQDALQKGIIANRGLENMRVRLLNEVYQAIYRGEIIPDNAQEKIREILENLLNGNQINPNFRDRVPEPEI